jgi:hypothetical protein
MLLYNYSNNPDIYVRGRDGKCKHNSNTFPLQWYLDSHEQRQLDHDHFKQQWDRQWNGLLLSFSQYEHELKDRDDKYPRTDIYCLPIWYNLHRTSNHHPASESNDSKWADSYLVGDGYRDVLELSMVSGVKRRYVESCGDEFEQLHDPSANPDDQLLGSGFQLLR